MSKEYKAGSDINTLIIFVDVRGFTSWAGEQENSHYIADFSNKWYRLLSKSFQISNTKSGLTDIKYLGDGAMIIREIKGENTAKRLKSLLLETVKKIEQITHWTLLIMDVRGIQQL